MKLNSTYTRDLVITLRVCLILIITLLCIAFAVTVLQLNKLWHIQNAAVSSSIPALERSQKMVGLLATITGYATRATMETSLHRLEFWSSKIDRDASLLREEFSDQLKHSNSTDTNQTEVQGELHTLLATATSIARIKSKILNLNRNISTASKKLSSIRAYYVQTATPIYLDATTKLHSAIDSASPFIAINSEEFSRSIKREISVQYGVVALLMKPRQAHWSCLKHKPRQ